MLTIRFFIFTWPLIALCSLSIFFANLVYDVIYCRSEDVLLGEVGGHVAPVVDEPGVQFNGHLEV